MGRLRRPFYTAQVVDGPVRQGPSGAVGATGRGTETLGSTIGESHSGPLAFLFTDIEGSTRRWDVDRAAMAADLSTHDAIMGDAVAAHGGRLFTHTGDGLGAIFPTVPDALAAAVGGQRALAGAGWKGTGPLRVRMAVHTGAAEARAGTFLGPTLNRTARLLDHAGGGDIVCSDLAAQLFRPHLPAGVALAEVGIRRLKGLSRPERLWRVLDAELLPAGSPLPPAPPPIPGALSAFVGREAELHELAGLLAETRLLTITGLGGAGKTRLAFELAAREAKHFADAARVVELVSVRDERLVVNKVLSVLGADPGSSTAKAAEEQLCQVLADRQLLLVLDNCEHLLKDVATLAERLLCRCADLAILATSREPLAVAGEVTWTTPGLSLPPGRPTAEDLERSDAGRLFIVRARAADPRFEAGADNAATVAAICRRLDGIPLALELAAARVRLFGVVGVADRLEDRFRLLVGGPRSAPSRHQTLQAALDWSYEQLSPAEQEMLCRLSVFPHTFDLDAAGAVFADDPEVLDVVTVVGRLIDTSLLATEGSSAAARYRLLETVREYAAGKLVAAGDESATRARHWRHFAERVRSAYRCGLDFFGFEWTREVAADAENYNAALTAALTGGDLDSMTVLLAGLDYPWLFGNAVPAVVDSITPDMLHCEEPSLHVEALFSLALGGLLTSRWTSDDAVSLYERAVELADRLGTSHDRGFARFYLGYMARSAGDIPTARAWMEEALRAAEGESKAVVWHVHYELGWIDMIDGATGAARDHFRRALAVAEAWPGHDVQEVHLRAALGLAEAIEENATEAFTLTRRAVEEAKTLDLPGVVVMALVRAAEAAVIGGASPDGDLAEAVRLLRDQGTSKWVAAALTVAALSGSAKGRHPSAAHLLGGAGGIAHALSEDPHPLPAIAARVAATRRRLIDTLGSDAVARLESAGRSSSLSDLLQAAVEPGGNPSAFTPPARPAPRDSLPRPPRAVV